MDLPSLQGRIQIDTSSLDAAVGKAARSGSMIGSAIGSVGGNLISKGLEVGTDALKTLSVDSINAASDLNETANKITTIFGPGAAALNKFADTADTKLGLSKQSALDAAATFGVFGKSAGLSGKDLTGFSSNLVGLSADLASFHNTSPEQAIDAIGAALRGESEPMRAYGVLLDDASMRQQALKMGLVKTTKEALTPQQKVLAAQALIMKQTSVAQGDFAKTSTGLANSQRVAKAQFENFQTQLGQGLLPVVNMVMAGLVKFMPTLQRIGLAVGNFIGPALMKIGSMLSSLFGAGGGLATSMTGIMGPLQSIGASLGTLVGPLISLGQQVFAAVIPALKGIWQVIVTNVWPAIAQLVAALAPLVRAWITAVGPVISGLVTTLGNVIRGVFTFIGAIIRTVASILTGNWSGAWENMKAAVSAAAGVIGSVVSGFVGFIRSYIQAGLSFIGTIFRTIFGGIVSTVSSKIGSVVSSVTGGMGRFVSSVSSKIGEAVSWFTNFPGRALGAIANLGGQLYSSGVSAIAGFINGIIAKAGEIAGVIRDKVVGVLPDFVKEFLGIHSPSRVMHELGAFAGEGWANGLASSEGLTQNAAQRLAEAALPTASATVQASALQAGRAASRAASSVSAGGVPVVALARDTISALATAVAPQVAVLLDGAQLAANVNDRLGRQATSLIRGGAA